MTWLLYIGLWVVTLFVVPIVLHFLRRAGPKRVATSKDVFWPHGVVRAYLVGILTPNTSGVLELTFVTIASQPALLMGKPQAKDSFYVTLLESEDCEDFHAAYTWMAEMYPRMFPKVAAQFNFGSML